MSEPSHIDNWNGLDRHHKPKTIEEWIAAHRPKEIRRYKENGHIVKVFEAAYGCRTTI